MASTEQLERAILHTLAYADVFDYPLTPGEIHHYLAGAQVCLERLNEILAESSLWECADGYYSLPGRAAILGTRRKRGEAAVCLWHQAVRYGQLIACLPFVRMAALTGSLALKNVDERKDIDYMIVTAPGRLWTCRALILLIVRLARLERVHLCPNYLLTEDALELADRSMYVARELAQMIPLSGLENYFRMRRLNSWTDEFLPNARGAPDLPSNLRWLNKPSSLQRVLELALKILPMQWFEGWERKRKIDKLSREQASSPEAFFSADVCKGHGDRHRQRTEDALRTRLQALALDNPVK